ncbi:MAG: hypothetical protein IKP65_04410 [Alphaproteobacteria bacterium]|nr:hypothetical protein [Alphaproteobacteria bacterium]
MNMEEEELEEESYAEGSEEEEARLKRLEEIQAEKEAAQREIDSAASE